MNGKIMNSTRPTLALNCDSEPIDLFVQEMQEGLDSSDADLFNKRFAADVLWEVHLAPSPRAASRSTPSTHACLPRCRLRKGASRYVVEHARFVAEHVAIAYVRRDNSPRRRSGTGETRLVRRAGAVRPRTARRKLVLASALRARLSQRDWGCAAHWRALGIPSS
jgi:hypothetical protein